MSHDEGFALAEAFDNLVEENAQRLAYQGHIAAAVNVAQAVGLHGFSRDGWRFKDKVRPSAATAIRWVVLPSVHLA